MLHFNIRPIKAMLVLAALIVGVSFAPAEMRAAPAQPESAEQVAQASCAARLDNVAGPSAEGWTATLTKPDCGKVSIRIWRQAFLGVPYPTNGPVANVQLPPLWWNEGKFTQGGLTRSFSW